MPKTEKKITKILLKYQSKYLKFTISQEPLFSNASKIRVPAISITTALVLLGFVCDKNISLSASKITNSDCMKINVVLRGPNWVKQNHMHLRSSTENKNYFFLTELYKY